MTIIGLVLFMLSVAVPGWAATLYIAPNGNDVGPGSSGAPWKTWGKAFGTMVSGDILIVKDGTYSSSNGNGQFQPSCTFDGGTHPHGITVKAEHERLARLTESTVGIMRVYGCNNWVIEGLDIHMTGANTAYARYPVQLNWSNYGVFKRNLVHGGNKGTNDNHAIYMEGSYGWLIEDNEVFDFFRHGILVRSPNCTGYLGCINGGHTLRRNYVNANGFYSTPPPDDLQVGIGFYPSQFNIIENNIVENSTGGLTYVTLEGVVASNNRTYGSVFLTNKESGLFYGHGSGLDPVPQVNSYAENVVGYHQYNYGGVGSDPTTNGIWKNITSIDNGWNRPTNGTAPGFGLHRTGEDTVDPNISVTCTNCLSVGNKGWGYTRENVTDGTFNVRYSRGYNNSLGSFDSGLTLTNSSTQDPQLGTCIAYIPDGSPMKGAGENGADIGANVLYRYINGVLQDGSGGTTKQPLWHTTTGQFLGGAVIPGVNDSPDLITGVHTRLEINTAGCPFPSSYDGEPTITASPANVAPGATITVQVANNPSPQYASSWVARCPSGGPCDGSHYADYRYLDNTQTIPATAFTNATLTFTAPASGTWEFVWFEQDVPVPLVLDTSTLVTVTGVQAYYSFPGDTLDHAPAPGGGHDGVLVGNASVATGALVLDGFGDYVSVTNTAGLEEQSFCISLDLTTTDNSYQTLVSMRESYGFELSGGGAVSAYIYNGSSYPTLNISALVRDGLKHALVLNHNGATMAIHVDGVQVGSLGGVTPIVYNPAITDMRIGRGHGAGDDDLAGTLDNVRLLNRPCTSAEIATWASATPQPQPPTNLRVIRP